MNEIGPRGMTEEGTQRLEFKFNLRNGQLARTKQTSANPRTQTHIVDKLRISIHKFHEFFTFPKFMNLLSLS